MGETKTCTKCKETKKVEEFNIRKYNSGGTGRHFRCKKCQATYSHEWYVKNRKRHNANSASWRKQNPQKFTEYLKKSREKCRFKASIARSLHDAHEGNYTPCFASEEELRISFTGYCAVCGVGENDRKLHMDHNHKTGKFRNFLCVNCNHALGRAGDSKERLFALANYLEKHE